MNLKETNPAAYHKYLEKYDPQSPQNIKKRKDAAAKKRKQWWANNWIAFSSLIVAIMALVVAVIALLK